MDVTEAPVFLAAADRTVRPGLRRLRTFETLVEFAISLPCPSTGAAKVNKTGEKLIHGHGGRLGGECHDGRCRVVCTADVSLGLLPFIPCGVRSLEILLAGLDSIDRTAAAKTCRCGKQDADPRRHFKEAGSTIITRHQEQPNINDRD